MNPFYKLNLQFFSEDKGLEKLQKDFTTSWKELKGLLDSQADEIKTFGQSTDETAKQIKSVEDQIKQFDADMKGYQEKMTDLETKFNRGQFTGSGSGHFKTVGQLFIESEAYKSMTEKGALNSDNVAVKSFFNLERKDLDSTDPKGGVLVSPLVVPGIITPPERTLRLRDVLNVQQTTSNAIEFIQETGYTNAAAVTAEKALAPQSSITFEAKTASVRTINHWLPATRQIIADAPQLRGYVDGRLTYGLKVAEESQVLYGSGLNENLQGLMTNTAVQDHGALPDGETMIDHLRRAITRAVLSGYPVTGIVLHPADFADIELSKGGDGHYIWVNVTQGGIPRLWAVPVIESISMTEGEFLLGAFGLGATLYDRQQASIRIAEQHADFFLRGQLAILCEERVALVTTRPESFVRGSFLPPAV